MLLPLRDLVTLYRRVQADALPGKASVAILTAADVDALAALSILTSLMRADCMQYSVIPMQNFSALLAQLDALQRMNATLRSVILLNCGAIVDLSSTWPVQHDINLYVLDCHRPMFHANAHHPRIIVVDDQTDRNLENLPQPGEFEEVAELEAQLEVGESSSEDAEDSGEEQKEPRKRQREEREEKIQKRIKIDTYYNGNYFGTSVAWLSFELAKQLNRENNDMLWMALVGVTEQLTHLKVDKFQYEQRCKEIQADIVRLNARPAEEGQPDLTVPELPEIGRVSIELKELRVMLLRHWTLYDSLFYSNIVASRFNTWKQQGRDKFHGLLVKLGVSLKDSQQLYKFMPGKADLKAKTVECLPAYNLDDLLCTSYVRQYDLRTQFSSADVVHAVAALLECPEIVEQNADEGFWLAYDALTDLDLLMKGAQMAIDLHKAIFALGTSLIEKKVINPTNSFRYAVINNDSWEQSRFFHYPYALKRLCLFLMEAYKEQRSSIKSKPMVLGMLNSKRGVYLVTGVMDYENCSKNTFRARFDEAVESTQAQHRTDFFEGELIEVSKDNFQAFLDALTNERDEF